MKLKLFRKSFVAIAVLLVVLAAARLYVNYQSANEMALDIPLRTDIKVMLYSKTGCGYCVRAKELLREKGIPYEEVELTNKKDLIIKLVNQTGQNTVPYVFVNDEFIGGYHELRDRDEDGNL